MFCSRHSFFFDYVWSRVELFSETFHIRWRRSIWKSPITAHSLYIVMGCHSSQVINESDDYCPHQRGIGSSTTYSLLLELFVVVVFLATSFESIFEKCTKALKETYFQYIPDYSVQSEFIVNRLNYIFGFIFCQQIVVKGYVLMYDVRGNCLWGSRYGYWKIERKCSLFNTSRFTH